VSNEDGRLPQRQHPQFYNIVARRSRFQRHHPQALPRADPVRQAVKIQRHVRYAANDVDCWTNERTFTSTTAADAALKFGGAA